MVVFIDSLAPAKARSWAERQGIPFVFHSPHVLAQLSLEEAEHYYRPYIQAIQTYALCPGLGYWVSKLSGDEADFSSRISELRRRFAGKTLWLDTPFTIETDELSQESLPSIGFWNEAREPYQAYERLGLFGQTLRLQ